MIYTRKGDKGKTSLFDGSVILKNSKIIAAIGALDELNSYLGVVRSENKSKFIDSKLKKLQENLFLIGSIVAGYNAGFDKREIREIEDDIDRLELKLPPQSSFVFFSGTKVAARLFYARALARRLERLLVGLGKLGSLSILAYVNRLSDYLFILGRYCNCKNKIREEYWENL